MNIEKKGIEGLKPKKRGRPSKIAKIQDKSKDIDIELSAQLTTEEDNSLNEAQLKEKIEKLEENNYWLELENDAIKKR